MRHPILAVYRKQRDVQCSQYAYYLDKVTRNLKVIIKNKNLAFLFNQSISSGNVPTEWKLARVKPIFKKGKRQDVNNYRPISIIPAVAKVSERIIYDQLFKYLNDNDLLVNCQLGFRSLHSTLTSLLEASNSWSVNIDNGLINGVIFIDLKKAFDTTDHKILL